MYTPQAGIFALGASSYAYLEFDIADAKKSKEFASGGVSFVIGFRPELWRDIVPDDAPDGVKALTARSKALKDSSCQTRNMMR